MFPRPLWEHPALSRTLAPGQQLQPCPRLGSPRLLPWQVEVSPQSPLSPGVAQPPSETHCHLWRKESHLETWLPPPLGFAQCLCEAPSLPLPGVTVEQIAPWIMES